MKFLFELLGKLFNRDWMLKTGIFSKGISFRIATLGMLVAFFTGLYSVINGAANALSYVMPQYLVIASTWIIPNNWNECLTAYVVCYSGIAIYRWQKTYLSTGSSPVNYS